MEEALLEPEWARDPEANKPKQIENFEVEEPNSAQKWANSPQFSHQTSAPSRPRHSVLDSDDENDKCCTCMNDGYLIWFSVFSYITIAVALLSIYSNLQFVINANWHSYTVVKTCIIRLYATFFLSILCCIELEWRYVVKKIRILDSWACRGFTYAFLGLITVDQLNFESSIEDVTGTILTIIGGVYFVMGILCLQSVKTAHQDKVRQSEYTSL